MAASMIVRSNSSSRPMEKIEVTVMVKVLSKHEFGHCTFRSHGYGDG